MSLIAKNSLSLILNSLFHMLVSERVEIENTNSTICWVDESIVHIVWNPNIELEKVDIDEVSQSFDEMTQGEVVRVVSQFGTYVNISPEAKAYAAEKSPECIALAYVITSLAQRILIRFYIRMRKRKNPTKVFNTIDEALIWLKAFE
jgi:hypothetical protein